MFALAATADVLRRPEDARALGILRERRAREAHERPRAPAAAVVDEARQAVASGALLTRHEHRRRRATRLRSQSKGPAHSRRDAHELDRRLPLRLLFERPRRELDALPIQRARREEGRERRGLDRLLEHVGADGPRGLHRLRRAGRRRHHDDRDARVFAGDRARRVEARAVLARVHERDVRRLRAEEREARSAVLRGERLDVPLRERARDAAANRGIAVDHQSSTARPGHPGRSVLPRLRRTSSSPPRARRAPRASRRPPVSRRPAIRAAALRRPAASCQPRRSSGSRAPPRPLSGGSLGRVGGGRSEREPPGV